MTPSLENATFLTEEPVFFWAFVFTLAVFIAIMLAISIYPKSTQITQSPPERGGETLSNSPVGLRDND